MEIVVGVDEVGRGSWAGPLLVAAVSINTPIVGLRDSKKLSIQKREELAKTIKSCSSVGFGWVEPTEIDRLGLTQSITNAIQLALSDLDINYDKIIIDGNYNFIVDNKKATNLINADDLIPEVSAASIVAKVERDNYMRSIADTFPHYGFDRNVGYGTPQHKQALINFGITKYHRRSFKPIKELL